jgi:acyl-coenzyme A thioesterase PaaI-like protein
LSDADTYRSALAFAAEPDGADAAVRLAAAVRRLNQAVAASAATDDLLDDVAAAVETLADRLEPHRETSRYPQGERIGGARGVFLTHPIIGATTPGAPPLSVAPDGERLVGRVTYRPLHEGPPGFVHGGVMAEAFDAMVVMTAGINGLGGFSRSLLIRFRRPAPLDVSLCYEGEIESTGERSTIVKVTLRDGDTVYAECTGDVATRAGRTEVAHQPFGRLREQGDANAGA